MMATSPVLNRLYKQRERVVRRARELARSGQYANLAAIQPELEPMEGFAAARTRLDDRALRAQLDQLCAIAQATKQIGPSA
jgi:hypothetical protein